MDRLVLLDTSPLGDLTRPDQVHPIVAWVEAQVAAGTGIVIPEISDYELRRELIRAGKSRSVERLDELKKLHIYLALSTPVMLVAAELWADARIRHKPGAADPALDGDVILAAQA